MEIKACVRGAYAWKDSLRKGREWPLHFNRYDSLSTLLDSTVLEAQIADFRKSGFFAEAFLDAYRQTGYEVGRRSANGTFRMNQELSEPLSKGNPWILSSYSTSPYPIEDMEMRIHAIGEDHARLKWKWAFDSRLMDKPYAVELIKENGRWKISHLDGFVAPDIWTLD